MDMRIEPGCLSGRTEAISSKSELHRILIAAAFADGETRVRFRGLSEDIRATVDALSRLGAELDISEKDGSGAIVIKPVTATSAPMLDCRECGTTARLLLAVASAACDDFTITGAPGLRRRPFAPLCDALAGNGVVCDSTVLPIKVSGRMHGGVYEIAGDVSSQYISGLLMAAPITGEDVWIKLTSPLCSAAYVDITIACMERFGCVAEKTPDGFFVRGGQRYHSPGELCVGGDWSNSAVWLAAGAIGGDVLVCGLDMSSHQGDRVIAELLCRMGADMSVSDDGIRSRAARLEAFSVDAGEFPDLVPVLAAVAAFCDGEMVLSNLGRLRIKESDRIYTTAHALESIGGDVRAVGDSLVIRGKRMLRGGTVDSSNDHRIVMLAALAAARCEAPVIIRGAEAINKSYPDFFRDHGLLGGKAYVI